MIEIPLGLSIISFCPGDISGILYNETSTWYEERCCSSLWFPLPTVYPVYSWNINVLKDTTVPNQYYSAFTTSHQKRNWIYHSRGTEETWMIYTNDMTYHCWCLPITNLGMTVVLFSHSVVSGSLWPHGLQHRALYLHYLEFAQTHIR